MKHCSKCVYFGDFKDTKPNSKFKWTHCLGQVYNLSDDTAEKCNKYSETISGALLYEAKKHAEYMEWAFPVFFQIPQEEDNYYMTSFSKSFIKTANINQLKDMALEVYTLFRFWKDQRLDGKAGAYESLFLELGYLIYQKERKS